MHVRARQFKQILNVRARQFWSCNEASGTSKHHNRSDLPPENRMRTEML